jgi:hypothetical protein
MVVGVPVRMSMRMGMGMIVISSPVVMRVGLMLVGVIM